MGACLEVGSQEGALHPQEVGRPWARQVGSLEAACPAEGRPGAHGNSAKKGKARNHSRNGETYDFKYM